MSKVCLDDYPIKKIGWVDYQDGNSRYYYLGLGDEGITHLDVYEQYLGEYSIIWIQAWKNDELVSRHNARNIDAIEYDEEYHGSHQRED